MDSAEQYTSERYEAQADSYNSIVFRLDPRPTIELIYATLMGWVWDEKKDAYTEVKYSEPMLHPKGVKKLVQKLYERLSVDTVLSNLDRNEINNILRRLGETLHEFVFWYHEEYAISEEKWNSIRDFIIDRTRIFLNRALNGRENELLARSFQQRETIQKSGHVNETQQQPTGGWGVFRK